MSMWSGHSCPLPLTFLQRRHEPEGHNFSRAVKRRLSSPAFSPGGLRVRRCKINIGFSPRMNLRSKNPVNVCPQFSQDEFGGHEKVPPLMLVRTNKS